MDPQDRDRLAEAVRLLESPGWSARMTHTLKVPMEWALKRLPPVAHEIIAASTMKAIQRALGVAISTMDLNRQGPPYTWAHRGAVGLFGGLGGFWGLPGLAVELPITTVVMLRSIADIARSEGEDLQDPDTRLACVQVFALGNGHQEGGTDAGYYAVRLGLARAVREAGEYIARKGLIEEGAPVLLRLIGRIAARFDIVVTEKMAAEIVPLVGAAGGAAVNLLFLNYFQELARGHFIVRSLERKYGAEAVKVEYENLAGSLRGEPKGSSHHLLPDQPRGAAG